MLLRANSLQHMEQLTLAPSLTVFFFHTQYGCLLCKHVGGHPHKRVFVAASSASDNSTVTMDTAAGDDLMLHTLGYS